MRVHSTCIFQNIPGILVLPDNTGILSWNMFMYSSKRMMWDLKAILIHRKEYDEKKSRSKIKHATL